MSETVARDIADDIITGRLHAGCQIPSLRELSERYEISPSTATASTRGLVQKGVLERRRGLGMFVARDAREQLLRERNASFDDDYVQPMLIEARRLGLSFETVTSLIAERNHT